MNSDYILSGKGQSALSGASWAHRAASNTAQVSAALSFPEAMPPSAFEQEMVLVAEEDGMIETAPAAAPRQAVSASALSAPVAMSAAGEDVEFEEEGVSLAAEPTSYKTAASARNRGPDVSNEPFHMEDVLDILNPLQHIPGVNMVYRAASDDKISGFAQIAGSVLYGGPLGIISGVINAIVQDETGKDMGETVMAALFGDDSKPGSKAPETMLAQNTAEGMAEDAAEESVMAGAAQSSETQLSAADNEAVGEMLLAQNGNGERAAVNANTMRMLGENPGPAGAALPVASSAPVAVHNIPAQVAQKKPAFGGILNPDATAAKGAPTIGDNAPAFAGLAGNQKFYPLANATRRGGGETPRMPLMDSPDVRLKSSNLISRGGASAAAGTTVPLAAKQEAAAILGLADKPAATLATPATPSFKSGSNPLPAQLIEDMMMMGIDKYQKSQSGGADRGPNIDIKG